MIRIGDFLQGRYYILQEIGAGGIGLIFLAEDHNLQKYVVIKKIKENYVERVETRSEVDILKNLHHTFLPQVYDFVQDGREVYTVMDYIAGWDLQQYVTQAVRVPENEIMRWLYQLLDVLEYLHGQEPPIYHSDIKPANIMITQEGNVCLIDFNISLGDNEKTLKGLSKWYSAPEQIEAACHSRNAPVLDARMDIYSLAASFYALMTGFYPNTEGPSEWTQESRQLYSEELLALLDKAMAADRRKRFNSAVQMRKELERIRDRNPMQRRFWLIRAGLYAVAAVMLTCGISMSVYGNYKKRLESWNSKIQIFFDLCSVQDEDTIIDEGIRILNSEESRKYMTAEEKGNILWQIGGAYLLKEDYSEAARYYQEAAENVPNQLEISLDYIVALIGDGQTGKASRLFSKIRENGGADEEVALLEGELLLQEGKYTQAGEIAEALALESNQTDIQFRACVLGAKIAEVQENPEEQLKWLLRADSQKVDRSVKRQIVQVASVLARTDEEKKELALSYAREICTAWPLSEIDRLNLAVTEIDMNRTLQTFDADMQQESREILEELRDEGSSLYQVSMYLAFLEYREQLDKIPEERNYETFLIYYEEAAALYKSESHEEKDEQMTDLGEIYKSLMERRQS